VISISILLSFTVFFIFDSEIQMKEYIIGRMIGKKENRGMKMMEVRRSG
jgi:hypothetical protein